jgi:hypothetical protein
MRHVGLRLLDSGFAVELLQKHVRHSQPPPAAPAAARGGGGGDNGRPLGNRWRGAGGGGGLRARAQGKRSQAENSPAAATESPLWPIPAVLVTG